jgi:hypothetical protein
MMGVFAKFERAMVQERGLGLRESASIARQCLLSWKKQSDRADGGRAQDRSSSASIRGWFNGSAALSPEQAWPHEKAAKAGHQPARHRQGRIDQANRDAETFEPSTNYKNAHVGFVRHTTPPPQIMLDTYLVAQ